MPLFSLRPFSHTLECPATPQFAAMVANALAPLVKPFIQKEIQAMSTTIAEAVANLQAVAQRAVSEVASLKAEGASKDATIAELNAKLEAAQAGDPNAVAAIDSVAASLDQVAPAPVPVPQPEAAPAEQPAA